MTHPVETICVLGGGSAGYLAAVTMRRLLPDRRVTLVHSLNKPVIGVGESTTAYLPVFLHRQLALDLGQFYAEVEPTWKLGIRFIWGPPDVPHFNYPFGFEMSERAGPLRKRAAYYCLEKPGHAGPISALMDHDLSPCVLNDDGEHQLPNQPFGYHIDNKNFLAYLDGQARKFGIEFITGDVVDVQRNGLGDVEALTFADDSQFAADLFVDCSGFESLLLGKALGERFVDYGDTLLCDMAIVGEYNRSGPILPYTTAETMDHGWCWRIELPDRVTVGYVHSSRFCSAEDATNELRQKNPQLTGDLRAIRFPSGRYQNYWSRNVIAIGNASGFVEPLEATALHVIAEQLINTCAALLDSDYRIDAAVRDVENRRFRNSWDSIRDFLAAHYKFNRRLNTPFWQYCRKHIDLGAAQPLLEMYQRLGPHAACKSLLPADSLIQFEGYLAMFIGQEVPTDFCTQFDEQDHRDWDNFQKSIRQHVSSAIPVRDALRLVTAPDWRW